MKKLSNQSYRYICFEIARLRTRWTNDVEHREVIEKRYVEVTKEFRTRTDNWFWKPHVIEKSIKEKAEFQGYKGNWITLPGGQKLFIREGETINEATERLKPVSEDSNDYIPDKEKPWDRVKISTDGKGDAEHDSWKVKKMLKNLPPEHVTGLDEVYVADTIASKGTVLQEGQIVAGRYVQTKTVSAGIIEHEEKILMNRRMFEEPSVESQMVFNHEVGHHVYYNKLTGEDRVSWSNFFEDNKVLMGRTYARSNPAEGFAENYGELHIGAWGVEKDVRRWFEKHGMVGRYKELD